MHTTVPTCNHDLMFQINSHNCCMMRLSLIWKTSMKRVSVRPSIAGSVFETWWEDIVHITCVMSVSHIFKRSQDVAFVNISLDLNGNRDSRPLLVKSVVTLYESSCMVSMVFFMHTLYLHVVLHGDCTVNKIAYTFARQILFSILFS